MSFTLNGWQYEKSPKDQTLISYPVVVSVAAGSTQTIDTESQFNGGAIAVQITNQDGANAATARINGITTTGFNVPASGAIGFSDQWINQIRITAGAAGATIVFLQIIPRGLNGSQI